MIISQIDWAVDERDHSRFEMTLVDTVNDYRCVFLYAGPDDTFSKTVDCVKKRYHNSLTSAQRLGFEILAENKLSEMGITVRKRRLGK